ncbi:hypothetical protein OOT00_01885 [Desulfobotulus sp. H1]|uniref:Uncharacterized protein n=1 Tax=Desulfobotulus pelophilus TaxID=2823377 RepID=A0ABT3N5K0_9BACT|nr:hypothetical protein [Desulfobotulus pelophilus]MCW7752734.1 hypothetical protein [Desulfobotulus pelophilus]
MVRSLDVQPENILRYFARQKDVQPCTGRANLREAPQGMHQIQRPWFNPARIGISDMIQVAPGKTIFLCEIKPNTPIPGRILRAVWMGLICSPCIIKTAE